MADISNKLDNGIMEIDHHQLPSTIQPIPLPSAPVKCDSIANYTLRPGSFALGLF
jgi:hypothetical protein